MTNTAGHYIVSTDALLAAWTDWAADAGIVLYLDKVHTVVSISINKAYITVTTDLDTFPIPRGIRTKAMWPVLDAAI